ncbi:MAG: Holliday junction resolvase RuvX [Candidatus Uhrbacteria bacterium]
MTILGIDYGTAKVGLAIASGAVATPLRVVRYADRKELRQELYRAIQEYDIREIVVGMPKNDRSCTKEVVEWMRREFSLPVLVEDEQLTTAFAKRLMRGWKGKAEDDAIAATLILQSHIEREGKKRQGS